MCENKNLIVRNKKRHKVFNVLLTLCIPVSWIILIFQPMTGFGQPDPVTIDQLSAGTFIFVMPTATRKLQYLQDAVDRASSTKDKTKFRSIAEDTQMEVDSFSSALSRAVQEYFAFARYELVPDSALKARIAAHPNEHLYIVRRGNTESGADALILFDNELKQLERPIPYYARLTRLSSVFDAFFGTVKFGWRDLDQVIRKWSERLEKAR